MRPVWRSSRLPRGKGIRQVESPALRRGSRRSRASRRGRQAARSYGVRTYGPREARADVHAMRDACRKLAYIHHVAHLVVGSATRKMTFFPGHGQHTNKIPTERGEREESIGRMLCYHRHRTTIRIPHNRYCQDFFSSASESALTPSRLTAGAAASRATPTYCAWRARSQQIATQSSPPSSSWPGGAPSRCSSPSHRGRRPQAT